MGLTAALWLLGGIVFALIWAKLPGAEEIETYVPPLATKVYDRNGLLVYEFYTERREDIHLRDLPPHVYQAFVALEDRNFWKHWGIWPAGVLRAFLVNLAKMRFVQGGSTITQQLARNMFLTHRRTITRKVQEAVLAVKIERYLTKEEILERYLNQIYFGSGVYGIGAAARHYFGKPAKDLTVAEAALLAAIPKDPSKYNPYKNPEAALKRRNLVLKAMLRSGYITKGEYEEALKEPLKLKPYHRPSYGGIAPYFVDVVRQYIVDKYGEDFLYTGGGSVYTTLDLRLQEIANRAVDSVLGELEKTYGRQLKYLYSDYKYDPKNPKPTRYLQAALVAMDPKTGEVLALVGGRNYFHSMFNRATQARRQTGSAFKPFVYLAAALAGYGSGHIVYDVSTEVKDGPRVWTPSNYDGKYLGPITMRRALALSRNLATVRLAQEVGMGTVVEVAKKAGIKTPLEPYYSTALGAQSLTLLEVCDAYATIADYGTRHEPLFVLEVRDAAGNVLERNEPVGERVFDSVSTYIVISMMESVLNEGTAVAARTRYGFQRPAAGKTGTTNDYRDAWFIGFTPSLLAGVWVGFDEPRTIVWGATGAGFALPVWSAFMREATKGKPVEQFKVPRGVVWVDVCSQSGYLATPYCPKHRLEVYPAGHEPTEPCPIHGKGKGAFELLEKQFIRPEAP